MNLLYIVIAVIIATQISVFIESIRIKKGKKQNVSKVVSVLIGAALFAGVFFLFKRVPVLYYVILCIGIRGLLYDPVLNILRGLPIDYRSASTNSILDKLEKGVMGFWEERLFYLLVAALGILLLSV